MTVDYFKKKVKDNDIILQNNYYINHWMVSIYLRKIKSSNFIKHKINDITCVTDIISFNPIKCDDFCLQLSIFSTSNNRKFLNWYLTSIKKELENKFRDYIIVIDRSNIDMECWNYSDIEGIKVSTNVFNCLKKETEYFKINKEVQINE